MHFALIDRVLERSPERVVAIKHVSAAEEYLQDHFPGFPVLPGVLMIEAVVQAGRELVRERTGDGRYVLGEARAIKYGTFVRPGETLRVEVSFVDEGPDGTVQLEATGTVGRSDSTVDANEAVAVSGRLSMRPVRLLDGSVGH